MTLKLISAISLALSLGLPATGTTAEQVTGLEIVPPPAPLAASGSGELGDGGMRLESQAFTGAPWDDGLAEVAEYQVQQFRYGELHPGTAVMIVVRENLDPQRAVKAGLDSTSTIPVLKCHWVTSYQTGVYRYEQAMTVFLRRSDAVPLRLFMTSHEWCGSAAKSWINRGPGSELSIFSYFDGHGDLRQPLALAPEALLADALPVALRAWLTLSTAESSIMLVPSQLEARTVSTTPIPALMSRRTNNATVLVTVKGDGIREELAFSAAAPHHLQSWRSLDGTIRTLTKIRRFDYWSHHSVADQPK